MIKIPRQLNKSTVLLFMMLLYSGVGNYFWRALSILIPISFPVFTGIVWAVVVLWTFPLFNKRLRAKHVLMYLVAVLICLVQWMIADKSVFSMDILGTLAFSTLPAFFVGVAVETDKKLFAPLYKLSIFVLIVSVAYSFYYLRDRTLSTDNMDYAYNVLPAILILTTGIFRQEKRKVSVIFSGVGFAFLLVLGTRGPVLCFVAFVVLMMIKNIGLTKVSAMAITAGLLFGLFINSQLYTITLLKLSDTIGNMGFSTRIIDMLLEENISDGNGRDAIYDRLSNEIKEEPFKIRGAFSDRASTKGLVDEEYYNSYKNGTYAHNLFLEIFHNYGVVLGGIILLLLLVSIVKLFICCKKEADYIAVAAICMGFVQLLVSGSYLTQPLFFMMIGLFMNGTIFKAGPTSKRGYDHV